MLNISWWLSLLASLPKFLVVLELMLNISWWLSLLASLPKFLVGGKWSVGADVEHHIQYRLSSCHGSNRTIVHAG